MVKMLALRDIEHFRAGGTNPQGWPFDKVNATGRMICRCCGNKIAKGDTGLVGYIKWADTNEGYVSSKIGLHLNCEPLEVERIRAANY